MGDSLLTFREQYNGTVFPTVGGQWVYPGSKIAAFVRSTGVQTGDDPFIANNLVTTLNDGLARCRSGMYDVVYVLPGHAENVTSATALSSLVAGTRIIGVGDPLRTNAPAFTWTALTAQWAINVANVSIENLNLSICGADQITKGILVTGTCCSITNCAITVATGAALRSAIAVEWGSGATYGRFCSNRIVGTAVDAGIAVKVVGGTVPSFFTFCDNVGHAGLTVATGFLNVTVAALGLEIHRNRLYNTLAASTACISFSNVACDGFVTDNRLGTKNDGVATAQGIIVGGASVLCVFSENYSVDEKAKSGVLTPGAVAT